MVVTDGSNLYPKLLAELWPEAQHQLCVFHVLKDINECVLDALRRLRRQLAASGIDFKDLQTRESSLEDIFVSLVRERA